MDTPDLAINSHLRLPLAELRYRFVRSSGPGGQHVNKAETQVELTFDVAHSPSLSDVQRQRVLSKLKNLIDAEGVLHLTAQSERSQLRNREAVTERFRALLVAALHVPKTRRPTKPSAAAKERRIASKKRRGQAKQNRQIRPDD
ncbi:MAG: aminoacyl-tRNA hydrolase [Thermoflexales bacterium]|nr:aminoacyl-tRNA hydrolase [Thermoflexales bacterium]